MPSAARVSAGIEAWVMMAGCSIRLSTPPRLSARVKSWHALQRPPRRRPGRGRSIAVTMPPKPPRIWRCASACCGWLASPG